MAGTATNAGRWPEADVWTAPSGSDIPSTIDTEPGTDWDLVGYLDGDAGVVKALDEDSDTLKAWGGAPIEDVSTFNGQTIAFTAIEDNDVVWSLIYQGSDAPSASGGVTTRVAKVPVRAPRMFLIELRNGSKKKRYLVEKGVVRPTSDITENETDLGGIELTINCLVDDNDALHTEQIKGYDAADSSSSSSSSS